MIETKDGLPVYHEEEYSDCTDNVNVGDMFWFVTHETSTNEEHMFKLRKTDDPIRCKYCPLSYHNCLGIGCCIEEVKN